VAAAVAVAGVAGFALEGFRDPRHALVAWTSAYGFGLGTALGALVLAMVFYVTGARWPLVLAPRIMATATTLPVFVPLFIPIAIGIRWIYPWAHEAPRVDESLRGALEHQRSWNETKFFLLRAAVYLVTWSALAVLLGHAYRAHVRAPSAETTRRQRRISAAGLPIIGVTGTFASFDWFMSVEPGWESNMYGVYVLVGGFMSAVSLVAVAEWMAPKEERDAVLPAHFHALGRLMLMSVILWAYVGFFQIMLPWIADLPREATFFLARSRGSFAVLAAVLLIGHFVLPFLLLLSRPLKRRGALLALVGAWLVTMNAIDFVWLVLPAAPGGLRLLDVAPFLAVSGTALAYGVHRLGVERGRPSRDPRFAESLRYRSP